MLSALLTCLQRGYRDRENARAKCTRAELRTSLDFLMALAERETGIRQVPLGVPYNDDHLET